MEVFDDHHCKSKSNTTEHHNWECKIYTLRNIEETRVHWAKHVAKMNQLRACRCTERERDVVMTFGFDDTDGFIFQEHWREHFQKEKKRKNPPMESDTVQ